MENWSWEGVCSTFQKHGLHGSERLRRGQSASYRERCGEINYPANVLLGL